MRQLKNVIERLVIMSDSKTLDLLYLLDHMQKRQSLREDSIPDTVDELRAVKKRIFEENFGQIQKAFLVKALRTCGGNVTRAVEKVGMKRPNFCALMKKHNVSANSIKEQL